MDIVTYEQILKIVKKYLWLAGIPYGNPKLQILYFIDLIAVSFMVLTEGLYLISKISTENMKEIAQLAPCTSVGFLSLVKMTCLSYKRKKMFALMRRLEILYNEILIDEEKIQVVKKDVLRVNTLTKYYFVLNGMIICVYNFATPLLILYRYMRYKEVSYDLPYEILLPFAIESWTTWTVVYLLSIFAGFVTFVFITCFDCIYCILSSQVCINFACLSHDINQLDKVHSAKIKDIIEKHQYILRLGDELEDIFTVPNLWNVLFASVQICVFGFNLMTADWKDLPGSILFLSSVLLQILMMSFFGENIINESTKVGMAAYLCKWLDMDEISKKLILIIIMRSQRPQKLTALKYYTICYGSFTTIISTSWSYFTIIRTMYEPK